MRAFLISVAVVLGIPMPALASCICLTCAFTDLENMIAVSGSMEPTFPTGTCRKVRHIDPESHTFEQGDVILYSHPLNAEQHIARLMALAGDRIQMRDGLVILNGKEVPQTPQEDYTITMERQGPLGILPRCGAPASLGETCHIPRFFETLPSGARYSVLNLGDFQQDNTGRYTVPEGMIFVLGDNRDNALDSRLPQQSNGPGFISVSDIVGVFESLSPRLEGNIAGEGD